MDVFILQDSGNDQAEYLDEMLALWGGAGATVGEQEEIPGDAAAVIVPAGYSGDWVALKSLLDGGAHLLLITPSSGALCSLGLDRTEMDFGDDGSLAALRLVRPLLHRFSHYSLPVLGRRTQNAQQGAGTAPPPDSVVWAYLYENSRTPGARPGVWTVPAGRGQVTVFAYDLVDCYRNLRQGRPENAGRWCPRSDNDRASSLFGPDWARDFESRNMPLADFHPMLLLRLIEHHRDVALPRIWQLPGLHQSAVLISGDEDGAEIEEIEKINAFLDGLGATMTHYIMPGLTKCNADHLQAWQERGHGFSVHPYPNDEYAESHDPFSVCAVEIERDVVEFRARFGQATRTVRNHRLFWSGYMDVPRLWQRLGIEMDCNYGYNVSTRRYSDFFSTPPACLPISFLDENFRRIDVLQQPCHLGDDVAFNPDPKSDYTIRLTPEAVGAYAGSLFEETLRPLGVPFAVCFHPGNFAGYANAAERTLLERAASYGAALISVTRWLDFWKTRRAWKLEDMESTDHATTFRFAGEVPAHDLSVSLPARHNAGRIGPVTVNGETAEVSRIDHFGEERILARLPEGALQAEFVVEHERRRIPANA
jgi:hypothetical protein